MDDVNPAEDMPEGMKYLPVYLAGDSVDELRRPTKSVEGRVSSQLKSKQKMTGVHSEMTSGALLTDIVKQVRTISSHWQNIEARNRPKNLTNIRYRIGASLYNIW